MTPRRPVPDRPAGHEDRDRPRLAGHLGRLGVRRSREMLALFPRGRTVHARRLHGAGRSRAASGPHPIHTSFIQGLPRRAKRLPALPAAVPARDRAPRRLALRPRAVELARGRQGRAHDARATAHLLLPHADALCVGPAGNLSAAGGARPRRRRLDRAPVARPPACVGREERPAREPLRREFSRTSRTRIQRCYDRDIDGHPPAGAIGAFDAAAPRGADLRHRIALRPVQAHRPDRRRISRPARPPARRDRRRPRARTHRVARGSQRSPARAGERRGARPLARGARARSSSPRKRTSASRPVEAQARGTPVIASRAEAARWRRSAASRTSARPACSSRSRRPRPSPRPCAGSRPWRRASPRQACRDNAHALLGGALPRANSARSSTRVWPSSRRGRPPDEPQPAQGQCAAVRVAGASVRSVARAFWPVARASPLPLRAGSFPNATRSR